MSFEIPAGTIIDVVTQWQSVCTDKRCLIEIALYRDRGVSSPALEQLMIDTAADRMKLNERKPMIDIHAENPTKVRNLRDTRAEFEAILTDDFGAFGEDFSRLPESHYKNPTMRAMYHMFKAGFSAGFRRLKLQGRGDMHYYVIGKLTQDGHTFSDKPRRHELFGLAVGEQTRLGLANKGVKFGIFALISTYRRDS